MEIRIPGRVYRDYLEPGATDMQAALGLSEPNFSTRGRGTQVIFDTTPDVAAELARYLIHRGDTMKENDSPGLSHVHRQAVKIGEAILYSAD